MRALKFLALGFIGWVAYSVLTAKPRVSGAGLPDEALDDENLRDKPSTLDPDFAAEERRARKGNGSGTRNPDPTRLRVRWCVRVPENTPTNAAVYVTGSHPDLGNWSPLGLPLEPDGPCLYCGELEFPAGTVLEYKFTRGSWEAVETLRGGIPRPNRALAVLAPKVVNAEVEAWSDRS